MTKPHINSNGARILFSDSAADALLHELEQQNYEVHANQRRTIISTLQYLLILATELSESPKENPSLEKIDALNNFLQIVSSQDEQEQLQRSQLYRLNRMILQDITTSCSFIDEPSNDATDFSSSIQTIFSHPDHDSSKIHNNLVRLFDLHLNSSQSKKLLTSYLAFLPASDIELRTSSFKKLLLKEFFDQIVRSARGDLEAKDSQKFYRIFRTHYADIDGSLLDSEVAKLIVAGLNQPTLEPQLQKLTARLTEFENLTDTIQLADTQKELSDISTQELQAVFDPLQKWLTEISETRRFVGSDEQIVSFYKLQESGLYQLYNVKELIQNPPGTDIDIQEVTNILDRLKSSFQGPDTSSQIFYGSPTNFSVSLTQEQAANFASLSELLTENQMKELTVSEGNGSVDQVENAQKLFSTAIQQYVETRPQQLPTNQR